MEGTGEAAPETSSDPVDGDRITRRDRGRSGRRPDDRTVVPFRREHDPAPLRPAGEPPLRTVIGEVLREERHRQERTLAEIAEQAAVSLPYLSEVERGTKEVSSDVLAAICDALDLTLARVLERCADRLTGSTGASDMHMLAA